MTQHTSERTRQQPMASALERNVAMRLAADEYERVASLLAGLTPEQWAAPTDCPGWDVRAVAGHLLGMAEMAASLRETARQQVVSKRRSQRDGGPVIDSLTALQVEEHASLTTVDVVEGLRRVAPRAVRSRRRMPAFVRGRRIDPQVVGGRREWWTLGYLLDTILTRDPFMHRIDITRATGAAMEATAGHEGVIVDDVVREWARRHGAPYTLELTGAAGGRWQQGDGGEHIAMDAFDFCRAVSGRGPAGGLLAEQVPF